MEASRSDSISAGATAATEPPLHGMHDYDTNNPPNSRLFVVCSKSFSEDDLKDIFTDYGEIQDVYIIRDKTATRASKGVCFIKFVKSSDACRAMEELNGKHVKDCERPIKVLMAQSRHSEQRSYPSGGSKPHAAHMFSGRGGGGGGGSHQGPNYASEDEQIDNLLRLFVTVDKKQTQEQVKDHFAKFGLVDHVHILKDKESGESRGVAYVKFYRASHAALALEEAGTEYNAILADPRPPKGANLSLSSSACPPQHASHNAVNYAYNGVAGGPYGSGNTNVGGGSYNLPPVYNSKNTSVSSAAPNTDTTATVNHQQPQPPPPFHHTGQGYSSHQVFHGYNSGSMGAVPPTGQQPPITPLFPNSPSSAAAAAAHAHSMGNAGAGLTAMLQQMAACGDDGASGAATSWISPHPTANPAATAAAAAAAMQSSQTLPTYDHINGACRTLGYTSCRIQAYVDRRATENQLRAIFDLIPGLEIFQLSDGDPRKSNPLIIAHATYSTPFAALYAKERLNAVEFPVGSRMTVKLVEDIYQGPNGTRFSLNTNGAMLNSTQLFNLQMTRAMAMGVIGNMPSNCVNAVNLSNGNPMIKSNGSPKIYQSSSAPMPNMGTGDSPQQEMDMANGVRGYFYPGGVNNICATAESYPSFTSSSSNGSATTVPVTLSKSTNAINQQGSYHSTSHTNPDHSHSTGRRQKRGPNHSSNSSGGGTHSRRNNSTGALKNTNGGGQTQRNFVSSANAANSNSTGNVNSTPLTNGTVPIATTTVAVTTNGTY